MGGRDYITCYDPANSLHIKTVIADNEHEIQTKIQRAKNAQVSWTETTFAQRRRVMRSLLKWLVENQEACARVACRDTGKTCESNVFQRVKNGLFCFSDRCCSRRNYDNVLEARVVNQSWGARFTKRDKIFKFGVELQEVPSRLRAQGRGLRHRLLELP